ncbi:MAG: hypothetical protein ACXVWU_00965 [Nocardioides sp.]
MGAASRGRTLARELLTTQLKGLEIGSAYDVRVALEGGELVVREGAEETMRVPADSITGAVWFSPEETRNLLGRRRAGLVARSNGLVVLLEGTAPVLGVLVAPFCPSAGSDQDRRETSGVDAVTRALGIVVESPRDHPRLELDLVRGAKILPRAQRSVLVPAAARVLAVATGAFAFWGWRILPQDVTPGQVVARLGASLVVGAVLVGWMLRQHVGFRRAVSSPPEPGPGATTYTTRHEPADRAEVARLVLGPDRVLAWNGALLRRLMGPAAGGVSRCVIGADVVAFSDAADRVLLQLDTSDICPDDGSRTRLARACEEAGIRFEEMPVELMTGRLGTVWRFTRRHRPNVLMDASESDEIAEQLRLLGGLAFLLQLASGLAAATGDVPAGRLLLAASVAECVVFIGTWVSYRRWENRVVGANA